MMIKSIAFFLSFFFLQFGFGQNTDFGIWLNASVVKSLSKKWDITADAQLRTNQNTSEIGAYYYSVGLEYEILKWLKSNVELRLKTNERSNEWRTSIGLEASYSISKMHFSTRAAYQAESPHCIIESDINLINRQVRIKPELEYRIKKKWRTSLSGEPLLVYSIDKFSLSRIRWTAGMKYKFLKQHWVALEYIFQTNYKASGHIKSMDSILSLSYKIDL